MTYSKVLKSSTSRKPVLLTELKTPNTEALKQSPIKHAGGSGNTEVVRRGNIAALLGANK